MKNINREELINNLQIYAQKVSKYKAYIAGLLLLLIYGYLFWHITSLNSAQPSQSSITQQANPLATARIDQQVVNQLQSLSNNNVNVQTLFDQSRNNPFQ
jgi:hypothetical protein